MNDLHPSIVQAREFLRRNIDVPEVIDHFWKAWRFAIDYNFVDPVVFADKFTDVIYNIDYYRRNHNLEQFIFLNINEIAVIIAFLYSYRY